MWDEAFQGMDSNHIAHLIEVLTEGVLSVYLVEEKATLSSFGEVLVDKCHGLLGAPEIGRGGG